MTPACEEYSQTLGRKNFKRFDCEPLSLGLKILHPLLSSNLTDDNDFTESLIK